MDFTWKQRNKAKDKNLVQGASNPSVLTYGSQLEGVLQSNESIRIDGEMRGNVYCLNHLIVGEKGKILGQVFSQSVQVYGEVEGDISCVHVVNLHAGSKVRGDIRCQGLQVDSEADFHGICETKVDGSLLSAKIESFRVSENLPLSEPADLAIYNLEVNVEEEWEKLLKEKEVK